MKRNSGIYPWQTSTMALRGKDVVVVMAMAMVMVMVLEMVMGMVLGMMMM